MENPKNHVIASSFADPADVRRFHLCKLRGGTDRECFQSGDNGIGCWGDDTTKDFPMVALPPEDWEHLGSSARGALVLVSTGGKTVLASLRDRMPHKRNIKNGCGIDLNPAACRALGYRPPIKIPVTWQWLESSDQPPPEQEKLNPVQKPKFWGWLAEILKKVKTTH